jgi:ABC-type uncharacterized transport system involved in gliding motility auxiliary subunit
VEAVNRRADLFGYAGLGLLAAAAMVRLLFAGSGPAALGLAVGGVVLFLVYFFRAGGDVQRFLSRRSTHQGGNVLGVSLFVLGALILVNVLAARFHARFDVTADRLFTLAPETRTALREAPAPPEAWVFYPSNDPSVPTLRGLLAAARLADPGFTYHVVDPERDPVQALKFGLREYGTVVQVGERHEVFTGTREEDFLAALTRASESRRTRVAFLRGHGEAYFKVTRSERSMREAVDALLNRGYDVSGISILEGGAISDSVDVLIIPGPQVPPSPAEMDTLRAFMRKGGRLLVMLDPSSPVTLDSLLAPAGLRFVPKFLSDPSRQDPRVIIPTEYSDHPATRALHRQLMAVALRGVGEVRSGKGTLPGLRAAVLLRSGPRTVLAEDSTSAPHGRGLAVAVQWKEAEGLGRMVVTGDADFATRDMFDVLGNGDLFLGSVQWLAQREDMIALRPRAHTDRPILITRQQGRALLVVLVVLLPLLILGSGGWAWWRRR